MFWWALPQGRIDIQINYRLPVKKFIPKENGWVRNFRCVTFFLILFKRIENFSLRNSLSAARSHYLLVYPYKAKFDFKIRYKYDPDYSAIFNTAIKEQIVEDEWMYGVKLNWFKIFLCFTLTFQHP